MLRKRWLRTWCLVALIDGVGISDQEVQDCIDEFVQTVEKQHQASDVRLATGFFTVKGTMGSMFFTLDGAGDSVRRALGCEHRRNIYDAGLGVSQTMVRSYSVDLSDVRPRIRGGWRPGWYPSRRALSRLLARCWLSVGITGDSDGQRPKDSDV